DLIAALGKNDQKIYVVPSMGLVVVRQGESAGGIVPAASSFDNQLWQRIMALECVTGTEQVRDAHAGLEIFPNPGKDVVTVKSSIPIRELRLLDVTGRVVKEVADTGTATRDVTLQGLPDGVYLIQVVTELGVVVKRLVMDSMIR
ncbi:MAG: T9SS type A sorting domain-containing protein, partial [Phaeodactylibacter sp.]|nr:T9SS type A sorting domain-containing protein [Phaeodactylibacter sp.]